MKEIKDYTLKEVKNMIREYCNNTNCCDDCKWKGSGCRTCLYNKIKNLNYTLHFLTIDRLKNIEEYNKKVFDWTKVKIDTPILVNSVCKSHNYYNTEEIRYFARYDEENKIIYYFKDGRTSLTQMSIDKTSVENVRIYKGE